MPTRSPAGVLTVPLGVVEVCQAGTSLTQPHANLTVPPRLGSKVCTPSPPISPASSTIATTGAPVRLAMSTVSPMWSAWPWVRRIVVGFTSSGETAALGFPLRNGSISTRLSPSESSKQAWPRKRTSIVCSFLLCARIRASQLARQLEAHRHPHQHAETGFLGDQRPHLAQADVRVLVPRRLAHGLVVSRVEPAALLERGAEQPLQRRSAAHHHVLGLAEPSRICDGGNRRVDLGVGVG